MTREIRAIIGSRDDMLDGALAAARSLDAGNASIVTEILYFDTAQEMLRVLSAKRMELLQRLRSAGAMNVLELAKSLGRDYKNVHTDVALLERFGLIERQGDKACAPFDVIHADFDLRKAA